MQTNQADSLHSVMPQHQAEMQSSCVPLDICPGYLFHSETGSYSFVKMPEMFTFWGILRQQGKLLPISFVQIPLPSPSLWAPNGPLAFPMMDSLFWFKSLWQKIWCHLQLLHEDSKQQSLTLQRSTGRHCGLPNILCISNHGVSQVSVFTIRWALAKEFWTLQYIQ